MKLRNKKTGEIIEFDAILPVKDVAGDSVAHLEYGSLAELNEEWEDAEHFSITQFGEVIDEVDGYMSETIDEMKQIGNYFETKEEAEKAVEKLKAWKRLKDKKFEFTEWYKPDGCEPFIVVETNIDYDDVDNKELQKDLDLLFGGEE